MNRQQKKSVVELFNKNFSASKGVFFVDYCGLTVVQMQQLRRQLREKGGSLKVAKMRLVKRALDGVADFSELSAYCKNQVGVVFAQDEAEVTNVAKALNDFAKAHASLGLVAGCVDAEVLNTAGIVRIASLPSKDVLLAQLCGVLQAPVIQLAAVLEEVKKQKQA